MATTKEVVVMTAKKTVTSSGLHAALEAAWGDIQAQDRQIPDVIILAGSRNRRPVWGHYAHGRWQLPQTNGKKTQAKAEVLIAAEGLNRDAQEVFVTLLHEAMHGLNAATGVRDTDRMGKYHNRRFRSAAEDHGLVCEKDDRIGCITVGLTPSAAKVYRSTITKLRRALKAYRVDEGLSKNKPPNRNNIRVGCECGRLIRVSRSTYDEGPITCGNCGEDFGELDDES